ncbi:MAG: aspartyl protease family protein [Akkermansiaceae bacterium]|nr:aspartyl protease family protein [Akkermansiaceae bacterium]
MPLRPALFLTCLLGLPAARGAADPNAFHDSLARTLRAEPLRWNAIHNEHLISGAINGRPAEFHIDSGAARSILALGTARRLGLDVTDTGRTQSGIGGKESIYSATLDSLDIGKSVHIPRRSMPALEMTSTLPSDGLIGGDILTMLGAVIDHRSHLMLFRRDSDPPVDLAAEAEKFGMVTVPLEREGNYHFLTARHQDATLRFVLDTGSQQSLLDSGTAERLGLKTVETEVRAAGVGERSRRPRLTSLGRMAIGDLALLHTPMLVMPFDEFGMTSARKVDGILGAEFLFASGAVFDAGHQRLFLPPGDIDVRPYSKTGSEMLASDEELAALLRASSWVGGVNVLRFTLESEDSRRKSPDPSVSAARLDVEVLDTIQGESPVRLGATTTVTVLLPHRDDLREWATGVFGRNPKKILCLPAAGTTPALDRALFTDGELPRTHIERVLKRTPR